MMRPLALVLLVGSALAGPALAVQDPVAGRYDPRVRLVAYNPMQVVRVLGAPFTSTQITFAPTETITQVAIGDNDAWLAAPAGNLLFIKPSEARAPTNMQVVTKRADGSVRSYQFELVARGPSSAQVASMGASVPMPTPPGTQFAIAFVYPGDAREAALAERRRREANAGEHLAEARLAVDFFYGPRNWRYTGQGSRAIEPAEVSDNGRMTAFRFPGNMQVPVIYAGACGEQEAIVPHTMRDDLVIVQITSRKFCLRLGDEVLEVANRDYSAVGQNPGTGTTSPEVVRSVREPRP